MTAVPPFTVTAAPVAMAPEVDLIVSVTLTVPAGYVDAVPAVPTVIVPAPAPAAVTVTFVPPRVLIAPAARAESATVSVAAAGTLTPVAVVPATVFTV